MKIHDLTYEAGWLTVAGLVVSFHRLAVGFYLSDSEAHTGFLSIALVVLGGLSAIVLTGAQMLLASTLAKVHDRLLEVAWWVLLFCAVVVMSASTLASMYGAPLAEVLEPAWLRARLPAVMLSVGLSLAIEISLAAIRRASSLLSEADHASPLHLEPHEIAELEVQQALSSPQNPESEPETDVSSTIDPEQVTRSCPHCDWEATWPTAQQANNSLSGHLRHCRNRG